MPIHDWKRLKAGFFHDFHHAWIEEVKRALNGGLLPPHYYALAEQQAGAFGPDVLTLQGSSDDEPDENAAGTDDDDGPSGPPNGGDGNLLVAEPKIAPTAVTDTEFYRRKKSHVAVRHVSDDRVVAVVEIVSPGNKSGKAAMSKFLEKASDLLLEDDVHLLVLDLFPPSPRDPQGLHAAIWDYIAGESYVPPSGKPLTLAAYESGLSIRAFVRSVAVGDALPEMPLFLKYNGCVQVPLQATYDAAFAAVPRRWRRVLENA